MKEEGLVYSPTLLCCSQLSTRPACFCLALWLLWAPFHLKPDVSSPHMSLPLFVPYQGLSHPDHLNLVLKHFFRAQCGFQSLYTLMETVSCKELFLKLNPWTYSLLPSLEVMGSSHLHLITLCSSPQKHFRFWFGTYVLEAVSSPLPHFLLQVFSWV